MRGELRFSPDIKQAYGDLEKAATRKLLSMLPPALQETYEACFCPGESDREHAELVKAADKLCAYLKCVEEMGAGNREFAQAEQTLRASVDQLGLPEVQYFMTTFMPSFRLTLDDLH